MKTTDMLQNMIPQIKLLLERIVFKNLALANKYKTEYSEMEGREYIRAILNDDYFLNYRDYWTPEMFQSIDHGIKLSQYKAYTEQVGSIPIRYIEPLRIKGREAFLSKFEEKNNYYRMLIGLPDNNDKDFFYPSNEIIKELELPSDTPVHLLSLYEQKKYMMTDEYSKLVTDNPDKKYLLYLGSQKVDLFRARRALDFEIIRYPLLDSDINPNLLAAFANLYPQYREYVMVALYNEHLADLYTNYREFMGVLIISLTLMQLFNSTLEGVNSHQYFDDSLTHTLFSMYGIPDNIAFTKDIKQDLSRNLLKLIRNKGTNDIYKDIAKIMGYDDIEISRLMLMRGELYDENGNIRENVQPYFIKSSTSNNDYYQSLTNANAAKYSYQEITEKDEQWWDLPDTREVVTRNNYNFSDSKYIAIDGVLSQTEAVFETMYFVRMILNNKPLTQSLKIELPDIFGSELISVYDCVLFILCAICLTSNISADIGNNEEGLFATPAFNFEFDRDSLYDWLEHTNHINRNEVEVFLKDLDIHSITDIQRMYSEVLIPLRRWLEKKITQSNDVEEFREYEALYKALFSMDVNRNPFLDDHQLPIEIIREKYNLTKNEMYGFRVFYPHDVQKRTILAEELSTTINNTQYRYPFLDADNPIDWYITLDIGINEPKLVNVYFYDILNHDDCSKLTYGENLYVFGDWDSDTQKVVINESIMRQALQKIDALDINALNGAYIPINETLRVDGEYISYYRGTKLASSIRSGLYKSILHDKLSLDLHGYAELPSTYYECLYRSNFKLYAILFDGEMYNSNNKKNKEVWYNTVVDIMTSFENDVGVQLKYLEELLGGEDLYFRPLVEIINRFKSMLVKVAKTSLKNIFDDKLDFGGSNMLKLFDTLALAIHFSTIGTSGYNSPFGLYDAMSSQTNYILLKDFMKKYRMTNGSGFLSEEIEKTLGSIHMSDECLLRKKNDHSDGINIGENEAWRSGTPKDGRWSDEDDILMRTRNGIKNIKSPEYDLEGWEDFVESLSPIE